MLELLVLNQLLQIENLIGQNHMKACQTFYLQDGKILLKYSEDDDIEKAKEIVLNRGDKFHIYRGLRHQMFALEDTDLFEFSTQHFEHDSNRVIPGD